MTYESKLPQVVGKLKAAENRLLHSIGKAVEGQATDLAPVKTGNLANSINYRVSAQAHSVSIGTPVEYGIYQELGTRRMSAQPYLEPAFVAMLPDIRAKARKEYGEIDRPGELSVRLPNDNPVT
jgi:HK97 gp10 family phage protein